MDDFFVGAARFELATSCSQSRRDNRATLRPEKINPVPADGMKIFTQSSEPAPFLCCAVWGDMNHLQSLNSKTQNHRLLDLLL